MSVSPTPLMQSVGSDHWKQFYYGPPGSGKSILGTGSQRLRTAFIDVDIGFRAIRNHIIRSGARQDLITHLKAPTATDFDEAFLWVASNHARFDLLVVDTYSELQRLLLKQLCDNAKKWLADQKDWGMALNKMEWYSSTMRAMPLHVIVLCHDCFRFDDDLKRNVWRPDMRGQFSQNGGFAKHFDIIARVVNYYVDGPPGSDGQPSRTVQRAVQFGPDPGIVHKDRSGNMAQYEPAQLDYLIAKYSAPPTGPAGNQQGG